MEDIQFSSTWACPSNIALIKYWGKKGYQLPLNPSLSLSLTHSKTITSLSVFERIKLNSDISFQFLFEGKENIKFHPKISQFIENLVIDYPKLLNYHYLIESSNSFPHSAGIASSASAFGAISLCFCDFLVHMGETITDFFKLSSDFARRGSGSASRSVYGNFSVWGKTDKLNQSSDYYSIPVNDNRIHPTFSCLFDSIVVVNSDPKKVSSTKGHMSMNNHPYLGGRLLQVGQNLDNLLIALEFGNWDDFISIVENEALSLHALMLSSYPGFFLLEDSTLNIINKIRNLRNEFGLKLCFTLDAGPNVHVLFPREEKEKVFNLLINDIKGYNIIHDQVGRGPVKIK
jgi:diphosphomevalonate decarboxylase